MKLRTLKSKLATLGGRLAPLTTNPNATPRLRGRAGVERRSQFLKDNPLCVVCSKQYQRPTAAAVVDHTVPLWAGGADDLNTNGSSMCRSHHDAKTACEATMRAAGGWLRTPCTCGLHPNA